MYDSKRLAIMGTFWKPSRNLLGTFREPSGNLPDVEEKASGRLLDSFWTTAVTCTPLPGVLPDSFRALPGMPEHDGYKRK